MTADEITAAYNAVHTNFVLITSLVSGNIEVVFALITAVAVIGVIMLIPRGLYHIIGVTRRPR